MSTLCARRCVATAMLLTALLTFAQAPATAPQPLTIEGARSYVYKTVGKDELRLHVFKPDRTNAPGKTSAIVFFFGGGFVNGSVTQFLPQAEYLAQRGMVTILADYRVFSRHGTTPFEAFADAKSAVRWVRAHHAELGVDPNRIAAAGGSAGGSLALSAAVFDAFDEAGEDKAVSSTPNALVLFNPAVDATRVPPGMPDHFAGRNRDASPRHHLRAGLPPMLMLHGKADALVPYADVEHFCAESTALGNDCKLIGYEDAPHGFFNPNRADGRWYRETLLEADRFLTKLGYLPKPTPTHIP